LADSLLIATLAAATTLVLVYRRRLPVTAHGRTFSIARVFAATAVAAVVASWGMGQYPWMVVDQMSIAQAAGATTTLTALLVVVVLAAIITLPALSYLLWFTQTEKSSARALSTALR
jgi:cytochrome d ubiquinol oxidase subunit II